MANIDQKNGIFHVRFRYGDKQFKKSLKTRNEAEANAARHLVETTLYRLRTGQMQIPAGVEPGDFIVSGGTQSSLSASDPAPTLAALVAQYLASQATKAPSTIYTEGIHLGNLCKALPSKLELPCSQVTHRDLELFLHARLRQRSSETVKKERVTVMQLFAWAKLNGYLEDDPAERLPTIKGTADRPPFRTIREIRSIIDRGGLSADEERGLWECLYLAPEEISELLELVSNQADVDFAFLLHALPAYTGMRRSEVLRFRWTDVNADNDSIVARSRKQSRQSVETTRSIDLHPELKRILLSWHEKRPRGQYVLCAADDLLPLDSDTANRAFWQPMRGTDWQLQGGKNRFKVGFHTYRHSFASNLAANGVDQRIIDAWMGHQTDAMRKRYRHLFPRDRKLAIDSFSFDTPELRKRA